MRIFLTGATGYVGGAVLDALLRGGHAVTALVRNNEKAARIAEKGAHPVIGDLADAESYRAAAEAQDGYVHAAYDSRGAHGATVDRTRARRHHRRGQTTADGGRHRAVYSFHHLHVRHLDPRAFAGTAGRERAREPGSADVVAR
jgi:uncharacterized protein YbjT (DUF2867 family)